MLQAIRPEITPLIINGAWDTQNYVLVRDWHLVFENERGRLVVTIKAGFITDGGSIPWWYRWRLSPTGAYLIAYLAHDGIYATEALSRSEADLILLELCEALDANWIIRNEIWLAVRWGGGDVWKCHTDASKAAARELVSINYTYRRKQKNEKD